MTTNRPSSPRLAMAYAEIETASVGTYLTDERYTFEQKCDGTRALVVVTTREEGKPFFRFLGRRGGALTHAAAALHFPRIEAALAPAFQAVGETVLDGEIMFDQGKYVLFDLPYMEVGGSVWTTPENTYRQRRETLAILLGVLDQQSVVVEARAAISADDKAALLARVEESGGEGIMVKSLDSRYEPGKRVKHSVKAKFVKTADVVVTASTRGRNAAGRETGAFTLAVYTEPDPEQVRVLSGERVEVGACSAIGKEAVEVGDVIEVAYLYMGAGGRLVQPRMLRVRDDKRQQDCTMAQFPLYSKALIS